MKMACPINSTETFPQTVPRFPNQILIPRSKIFFDGTTLPPIANEHSTTKEANHSLERPLPTRRVGLPRAVLLCTFMGAIAIVVMIGATTQMIELYTNVSSLRYLRYQVAKVDDTFQSEHRTMDSMDEPNSSTNYMLDLVLDVLRQDVKLRTQEDPTELVDGRKDDTGSVLSIDVSEHGSTTNSTGTFEESTVLLGVDRHSRSETEPMVDSRADVKDSKVPTIDDTSPTEKIQPPSLPQDERSRA